MPAALEVLLIDNPERDLAEVPGLMAQAAVHFSPGSADSLTTLRAALESRQWDAAICAWHPTGFSGLPALALLQSQAPRLPVLVVSGVPGEEAAVAAMKAGAADYLTRARLDRLVPAMREAMLRCGGDMPIGRAAENALRESEAGLRRAQLLARLAHIITRPDGSFESYSESLLELLGVGAAHVPSTTRAWLNLLHPEEKFTLRIS